MPRVLQTAHDLEEKWRSKDVEQKGKADFSSLHLNDRVLAGLKKSGYKTPSPIQALAIPPGIFGRDLLVQAKSGTGKTLVFAVVALQSLLEIKYPQVLIMVPTREIAVQVRDCVRAVGSGIKGLKCCSFIGGIPVSEDEENVVGCQIIVGTPGRLKQLITIGYLKTNSIRLLVLDEADNLLEEAFILDLNYIFQSLPKAKQVIATSATYPAELKNLIRHYFRSNIFKARLNKKDFALLGMIHYIKIVQRSKLPLVQYKTKLAALEKILSLIQFTQCLVFCNLKSLVESLCCDIRTWGFTTTYISADKEQLARLKAIDNLKRFRCKVLVTSDVTARGIDAENVDLVINFDKPYKEETYFHRCGRAGRYGSKGLAVTLLIEDEMTQFKANVENKNFQLYLLPDPIPKNLINVRPMEQKPKEASSDFEKQENSVDVISNGAVQNGSEENTAQMPEVEIIELDSEISLPDSNENKECRLVEQNESEKCVSPTVNGLSSNSEQANKDITAVSSIESNCEINELNFKFIDNESAAQNEIIDTLLETKVGENSCDLVKENGSEQQEKMGDLRDSCQDSLSGLPSNASDELEALLAQTKKESGCEKGLELLQILDQVNNSSQAVTSSAQAEPVEVVKLSELQKSLVTYLLEYEEEKNLESIRNFDKPYSSSKNVPSNTVVEKCKNIRKNLADFYHKIYKSCQAQSIDKASLKNFKIAYLMATAHNRFEETETDKTNTAVDAKTTKLEPQSNNEKGTEQLINKEIDVDSDSSSSNDSRTSGRNLQSSLNVGDQTFASYISKGLLVSNSIPTESSDSDSEELLDDTIKENPFFSSSRLQSQVSKNLKKCPKSSHQNKTEKYEAFSKNKQDAKKKSYLKKNNSDKNNSSPYLTKRISEASSDSDSEKISSDSLPKDNFGFRSGKLQSNVSKKYYPNISHKKYNMPSETFLNQVSTSKNTKGVQKRAYLKKNYSGMNEYTSLPTSKNEHYLSENNPSYSQIHNGAKFKGMKTFHTTATPSRLDVSYQQRFNKSSKNRKQKKAFSHETYENSISCNYGNEASSSSYPYHHQHYDYFPTSATANEMPVLKPGYSNHQCSCFVRNISHNNMSGDLYNIFFKQWEFIQNFSYPKH